MSQHAEHERHAARAAHAGHGAHAEQRVPAGPEMHAEPGRHAAHDKHAGHSVAMFRDKFWITLLLTIPTLIWGHMLPRALGYTPPAVPGARWVAPAFGTAVFVYGGWVFLQGALRELRTRLPGMMTLIGLAITVAFTFSAAVTLGFPGMPLWEELATLVTIMLLGHWIEMRSITQARGALGELAKLLPDTALRIRGNETEEVPAASLQEGDLLLIRPGASVPADGVVRGGASAVNEAMITGESRPVDKREGDRVIAGTVNGSGSLRVEVTGTGERTALAGIMRLVEQAQASRSRAQALADRAAFWLVLIALGAGTITLFAWLTAGAEPAFAVERLVTVLVIACPHALGLAIPLVVAISTTLGARGGLLVRDRRGLEEARNLTSVVFDKTGTLTLGEHRVVALRSVGLSDTEALRLAAAVEQDSEHPVARAVVMSASERGVRIPSASGFEAIPGYGVQATVEGRRLAVGGPNLLDRLRQAPPPELTPHAHDATVRAGTAAPPELTPRSHDATPRADTAAPPERTAHAHHAAPSSATAVPDELAAFARDAAARGQGTIYLVEDGRALAGFAVADAVRPESAEAVRQLHELGIEVVMLTGDVQEVADAVARELGIDTVFARVLPDAKAAKIEALQRQGKRVAMVGDGVNDAPALVTADVGVAIGAGTGVAVEAGDIVLVRSDPRDVPRIIRLSRVSYRKMIQNLWWATGYNVVAIPLAAGLLARYGILLSPAVGAILMSFSTVIVAANAQLLRRARL